MNRQTEDDGDHARRCGERADRRVEDEAQNRQCNTEINDCDDEILQQASLPGPLFQNDVDADEADQGPSQVRPP